jgi:hypothetical protein
LVDTYKSAHEGHLAQLPTLRPHVTHRTLTFISHNATVICSDPHRDGCSLELLEHLAFEKVARSAVSELCQNPICFGGSGLAFRRKADAPSYGK